MRRDRRRSQSQGQMLKGCVPWPAEFARRVYRAPASGKASRWPKWSSAQRRRQPHKMAVVHGGARTTYEELIRSAKGLASGLASLGLRPQDRVVVQLPNCPEFVSLYLALNYIGVIPVMALRAHRHAEIRHFVRSSARSRYFIADRVGSFDYRPMAAEMAAEFPSLRHVVVAGEPGPNQTRLRHADRRTARSTMASSTSVTAGSGGRLDDAAVGRNDVAVEADPADPQRLRLQRPRLRRGRRLLARTRCSWPCCRWGTTTIWRARAARRLLRWRHARHRQEHRRRRGVHDRRSANA